MHEVSIALSLLEVITEKCSNSGFKKIRSVKIEVGKASGIMPDALFFSFNAIKTDTSASDAGLEIVEVPVTVLCKDCGRNSVSDEPFIFFCPFCSSNSLTMIHGRELNIIEIEVD